MTATKYTYTPHVEMEVERMIRDAIPLPRVVLRKATLPEDFGGVDAYYIINGKCPIQIRTRHNRPANAADIDVTVRSTEPAMMAAGTYAPLWLTAWFVKGYAVAGKLIDVYRMHERADPPLNQRPLRYNPDGTAWFPIEIAELHRYGALLRNGDRDHWAASCLAGNTRTQRIIEQWNTA